MSNIKEREFKGNLEQMEYRDNIKNNLIDIDELQSKMNTLREDKKHKIRKVFVYLPVSFIMKSLGWENDYYFLFYF